MKIYEYSLEDYTVNHYIDYEEDIKTGMQLRIEGRISEVDDLLESINYEIVTEGHEEGNLKRVYIKVLPTEIIIKEQITCKEFKEKIYKAIRFGTMYNDGENFNFDDVELKTIVWHSCDGLYSEIYLVNNEMESLLDIAFIDGKDLYKTADTIENTSKVITATKKALRKYSKWCENFDIKINTIEECNL